MTASDADNDSLQYTYTWIDPTGAIQSIDGPTGNASSTLPVATTFEGTWTCAVTPNDGSIDGTGSEAFVDVEVGCVYGEQDCPGLSCQDILDSGGSLGTGVYYIDPDGQGTFDVYCFMDGLDGLVAGCMALTIATLALVLDSPWPFWALVGSLLGFLLFNWSPAKVFMGDIGSTFLGAVFVGLVLQASSWSQALGCLLVATPLMADACFCVPRRLLAGQRVFQAHRLHLFQRLHQAGWPHARVSLTYIAATALLALAMLAGGCPWVFGLAVAELLLGVWLDQRVAVPFAVASKS